MALEQLAYRRIPQARVQVFDWPVVGRGPRGFRGGPVLTDAADAPLRHTRGRRPVDSFRPDEDYADTLPGQYVYAGPVYGHFGHYMAEFAPRIAAARMRGLHHPLLFVSSQGANPYPTYSDFPDFVKEFLAFLDIQPRDVKVINRNTIVEVLHMTEAGSNLAGGPKPGYVEALTAFCAPKLDALHGDTRRPRKLYVSRSALRPQGMLLGEAWFEEQLERDGFTVFRPEEWRFSPQLDHYRKAEIVVFPEGSACHGTELLGAGMMRRSVLLPRRDDREAAKFARIVAPRSQDFVTLTGCTEYLGTAISLKTSGVPDPNRGVARLHLDRTIAAFRTHGLADLEGLSAETYRAAAEADLRRYLDYQSRTSVRFDEARARALSDAFAHRAAEDHGAEV